MLAYVSAHWEDDPDLESIEAGLNCDEHRQEPYDTVLAQVTPIFQEPPEELDETWRHGSLIGGICEGAFDTFSLADSYKLAGDMLVDAVPSKAEAYELVYPIVFNYRHAVELYLKAILSSKGRKRKPKGQKHNLGSLLQKLQGLLTSEYRTDAPEWLKNLILTFNDFDPGSTTFRYGDSGVVSRSTGDGGEFWVDLPHLKRSMGWLAESFQRIRHAQPHS